MNDKDTLERLERGKYHNNKVIVLGGVPFTARDVLVKAPLIAGVNVYLVGGTGEGKTELANDLVGYFGNSACYTMGRPDFEPSELLKQVRNVMDAKAIGFAIGRNVWQHNHPLKIIKAVKSVIFNNKTPEKAMKYLK